MFRCSTPGAPLIFGLWIHDEIELSSIFEQVNKIAKKGTLKQSIKAEQESSSMKANQLMALLRVKPVHSSSSLSAAIVVNNSDPVPNSASQPTLTSKLLLMRKSKELKPELKLDDNVSMVNSNNHSVAAKHNSTSISSDQRIVNVSDSLNKAELLLRMIQPRSSGISNNSSLDDKQLLIDADIAKRVKQQRNSSNSGNIGVEQNNISGTVDIISKADVEILRNKKVSGTGSYDLSLNRKDSLSTKDDSSTALSKQKTLKNILLGKTKTKQSANGSKESTDSSNYSCKSNDIHSVNCATHQLLTVSEKVGSPNMKCNNVLSSGYIMVALQNQVCSDSSVDSSALSLKDTVVSNTKTLCSKHLLISPSDLKNIIRA